MEQKHGVVSHPLHSLINLSMVLPFLSFKIIINGIGWKAYNITHWRSQCWGAGAKMVWSEAGGDQKVDVQITKSF